MCPGQQLKIFIFGGLIWELQLEMSNSGQDAYIHSEFDFFGIVTDPLKCFYTCRLNSDVMSEVSKSVSTNTERRYFVNSASDMKKSNNSTKHKSAQLVLNIHIG